MICNAETTKRDSKRQQHQLLLRGEAKGTHEMTELGPGRGGDGSSSAAELHQLHVEHAECLAEAEALETRARALRARAAALLPALHIAEGNATAC
jgi:hypothetical protein